MRRLLAICGAMRLRMTSLTTFWVGLDIPPTLTRADEVIE
jgi:hypothetical protein